MQCSGGTFGYDVLMLDCTCLTARAPADKVLLSPPRMLVDADAVSVAHLSPDLPQLAAGRS